MAASATTYNPMTIQAGGGTFVNPLMQTWATAFAEYTGTTVLTNYQAVGSGAGITGILKQTFMFAGSDAPVSASQSANYTAVYGPLLQFPETLGGVAIFYNVPGVKVSLNFTGSVIAKIYLGTITKWNDPAIAALNPGCHTGSTTCVLPANPITPVHRSDGSGTTYALTNYFEKVSTAWNASFAGGCPCYGTSISWPSSEIGAKGSSGVASYVKNNPNTIGYADSYYAISNKLQAAAVQNQAGKFVKPTLAGFTAAATAFSAQVQAKPTFTITNAPGASSYPISTFTYLLVWEDQTNAQQGFDIAQFFWWMVNQGQEYGPGLNYAKLPTNLVAIDESIIQQMNYNGAPFIQATTTTTVSCNQASVALGSTTTHCMATVLGSVLPGSFFSTPSGNITWSQSGAGFASFVPTECTLSTINISASSCSVTIKGSKLGSVTVTAAFSGDWFNQRSSATTPQTIAKGTTTTKISCTKSTIAIGAKMTCTATMTGTYSSHTGTITWSKTTGKGGVRFSSKTCILLSGRCSVTVYGTAKGSVTIEAAYGGDSKNLKSSGTLVRTIS